MFFEYFQNVLTIFGCFLFTKTIKRQKITDGFRILLDHCFQSGNGLSFLGARIFPAIVRIKPENLHRARRRMVRKHYQLNKGEITTEEFQHSMNSYWAYLSSFDTLGLRQRMVREGF